MFKKSFLAGMVVMCLIGSASAQFTFLTNVVASEDTFIDYWDQSTDHGEYGDVALGPYSYRHAYFKFDLTGLTIPANKRVAYVALGLIQTGSSPEGLLEVHEANSDSWNEHMLWNTQIGGKAEILHSLAPTFSPYFDVTGVFKAALAGDKVLSLYVTNSAGGMHFYATSENADPGARPKLVVYTSDAPTINPVGSVDGVVGANEYDTICYDLFGSTNSLGTWVSEGSASITDIYRWGCKVENGTFYGFIELKNRDIAMIDGGTTCGPCSFFGFFVDADNNSATGYAHKDFANDNGFDVDLEVGNDNGYLGQSGTINFWFDNGTTAGSNFGIPAPATTAHAYYLGNVLEISCPVADILTQTGVSAANGRFWRIAPRVAGRLDGSGAVAFESDVADAAVIDITNKSPKVIPVLDGQISAEEWAGGLFCDKTVAGTYAETDGTASAGSTSDIQSWGAKIINGVYYGFVQIDTSSLYSLDAYFDGVNYGTSETPKYRRCYINHFIDVDGNMVNGFDACGSSGFPGNMDYMFDLAFEAGITNTLSPMTLFLADTTTSPVQTNIHEFWNAAGDSYVYEWSCPMSVIAASAANVAEVLRVSPRFNANLRDIGSWSVDVGTPAMIQSITLLGGDANLDDKVDVGDLGILAANYGGAGKHWSQGDFNNDGKVDVGDLGILAAHYGTNASSANFDADYQKAFATAEGDDEEQTTSSICNGLGLPMIVGLLLAGLTLVKLEE